MGEDKTLHIVPDSGGGWAVRSDDDSRTTSLHPTQGLAVAQAWEVARDRRTAEVIVHGPDGAILSSLTIRRIAGSPPIIANEHDEAEDESLRREAERITPGRAAIDEMIGRLPRSSIDYGKEADELPC